jgi:hypothetical protein
MEEEELIKKLSMTGNDRITLYLSEFASLSAKIKTEYKQLFFYLAEANEQGHKYLAGLQVKSQDRKELLTAALFARMLSAYQAMILLAERGFTSEVRATCRSILEAKFKLGYLAVEPKAAEMMLAKHEKERIKRLEQYKSGKLPVHKQAANQDWDKLIADAKARQENLSGPIPPSIKSSIFLDLAGTELISGDEKSAALHAAAANSLDVEVVGQDIRSVSIAEGLEIYGFGRQFSAEDIILQIGTPEQKMELLARRKGKVLEDFFGSVDSDDQTCKGTWKLRREIFADELARSIQDADGDPARVNSRALLIEQLQRGERGCRQTSESDGDDVTAAKLVKAIPEKAVVFDFISYPQLRVPARDSGLPIKREEEMVGVIVASPNGVKWKTLGSVADITNLVTQLRRLTEANGALRAARDNSALLLEEAARSNAGAVRSALQEGVQQLEHARAVSRRIAWLSLIASIVALVASVGLVLTRLLQWPRIF